MLSQDLTRYVDLHRSLGFKFRIQHSLLRNFVAFAEAQGDELVAGSNGGCPTFIGPRRSPA
jgi:hypothetical protein